MENTMKNQAKETKRMRSERISETNNGMTLRTRAVPNKKKYDRNKEKRNKFNEN